MSLVLLNYVIHCTLYINWHWFCLLIILNSSIITIIFPIPLLTAPLFTAPLLTPLCVTPLLLTPLLAVLTAAALQGLSGALSHS